jgi:phosphatidylserine synthase
VANRYLIANPKSNVDVEWAYCFDVHLNAVLPLLTILHVGQLPFLNCKQKMNNYNSISLCFFFFIAFAVNTSFLYCLVGNTVWVIAVGYYIYILFLGFSGMKK